MYIHFTCFQLCNILEIFQHTKNPFLLMTDVCGCQNLHHNWDSLGETVGTQNISSWAGQKVICCINPHYTVVRLWSWDIKLLTKRFSSKVNCSLTWTFTYSFIGANSNSERFTPNCTLVCYTWSLLCGFLTERLWNIKVWECAEMCLCFLQGEGIDPA